MKYNPELYARAFAAIASKPLSKDGENLLIKNFVAILKKNGDIHRSQKILVLAERALREKTNRRKVIIETARESSSLKSIIQAIQKPNDVIETKINPELIAGTRITVNDTEEFDGSLKRKLEKLFA